MEKGGELAQNLAELYVFSINQIYLVNATKNPKYLDNVIGILSTLKEGWEAIGSTLPGFSPERKNSATSAPVQILSTQA
jgi:flagellar protein FliS